MRRTRVETPAGPVSVPTVVHEFWTSKQRAAHSLHEVPYRACFKPQLPRFFIERLTRPGEAVYDPFMGRGTTLLEAALLGRVPIGSDANPIGRILLGPRLCPPTVQAVEDRLRDLERLPPAVAVPDLRAFYHPATLDRICRLRRYLLDREAAGALDDLDRWIRMVTATRLTGHSAGFLSVYTLPPNQAVSSAAQRKINSKLRQRPPKRDLAAIVLRKTRALLADCDASTRGRLAASSRQSLLLTRSADSTPEILDESISLVVTSPPFLDVVDYAGDNWLRSWFCGIDPGSVALTTPKRLEEWAAAMTQVFLELGRILRVDGHLAFEVGEIRSGRVRLEDTVIRSALAAGLVPRMLLINDQTFTKTSNCWGVQNQRKGTNTNRIVLLRKGR